MGVNVELDRAGILHDCGLNIVYRSRYRHDKNRTKKIVWTEKKQQQKEPLNQCLCESLECLHSAGV